MPIVENCTTSKPTLSFGNGETILLVEREEKHRKLGRSVLEKLNYQVVTIPDQQEFSARQDIEHGKIDLLILDGAAPISESKEIVRQVRQHRPEAKTIFSSVHDTQLETECGRKIASERIIGKPFRIVDFSWILSQTLR